MILLNLSSTNYELINNASLHLNVIKMNWFNLLNCRKTDKEKERKVKIFCYHVKSYRKLFK